MTTVASVSLMAWGAVLVCFAAVLVVISSVAVLATPNSEREQNAHCQRVIWGTVAALGSMWVIVTLCKVIPALKAGGWQ